MNPAVPITMAMGLLLQSASFAATDGRPSSVSVSVDTGTVVNTMRGGIGASWHALEEPILYSDSPHPVFGNKSHGGSGWGAYPPAEDAAAWQQIDRHARWLGLDWNRVELEQRIYEPQRGQFTWDNREMRILYRILDWCETNKADVFLQQMWGNVAWNAFPEWRDDPAGRVHSGPASMDDFAEGLARLVEHLVRTKGYTCIRWLSINNEPNGAWSWWLRPPNRLMPLRPGLAAVRKALDARGLHTPLSGPDMTGGVPPLEPQRFDFLDLLGAYDFHTYDENFDWLSNGQMQRFDRTTADWASWAHRSRKPLFVSEFGTMANGWGSDHPGPSCYESVLKDAELVVRRISAGVDGFNRWSFINRGDLDGQWQFIETWDRNEKKLLRQFTPHANTYFLLGLLSRFTTKGSDVLRCQVDGGHDGAWQRVFATALRGRKGNITLAVVNDAKTGLDVSWELRGIDREVVLHRYAVNETQRDRVDLTIEPLAQYRLSRGAASFKDRLAPMSLTIYSMYRLSRSDDGATAE